VKENEKGAIGTFFLFIGALIVKTMNLSFLTMIHLN
jgi:hypothetical protein